MDSYNHLSRKQLLEIVKKLDAHTRKIIDNADYGHCPEGYAYQGCAKDTRAAVGLGMVQ